MNLKDLSEAIPCENDPEKLSESVEIKAVVSG